MALPENCRALRRVYVDELARKGLLKVEHFPTGVLVITHSKTIGIATKNKGKRKPWRTIRMCLRRGWILVPRMMSIFTPKTINVFRQLGKDSPPATKLVPYGENGFLVPIYMCCNGWEEFTRMSHHILGEDGYGVAHDSLGEIAELFSLLDQLEVLEAKVYNWQFLTESEKVSIDVGLIRIGVLLSHVLDPMKTQARDRFLKGIKDRLDRINPLISQARQRRGERFLESRVAIVEQKIVPIIKIRESFTRAYHAKQVRTWKRILSSIGTRIRSLEQYGKKGSVKQLENCAQSIETLAGDIRTTFIVRPYRHWAHQSAARLEIASQTLLHEGSWQEAVRLLENARVCMSRIPLE